MANKMTFTKNIYSWNDVPALMTTNEAALLLKMPEDTVRQYCQAEQLPARRIGKQWRIDKQKLMEQFGYAV